MTRLGKFVSAQELMRVVTAHRMSGMWTSGGMSLGDPGYEVRKLALDYGLPEDTGLDLRTGEFISKAMPENPFDSVEYEQFVASMVPHCHCSARYRPCDGVLAGGICDGMSDEPNDSEDDEPDDQDYP